ncbi:uncharacterized protein LOC134834068 [Culicoides brevitarsis]|uniref:uncharacterized protein LOC134834068 n=1 Tax=Culicoides brevitarsis TaxID=469753 RepID=UPI00307CB6A8
MPVEDKSEEIDSPKKTRGGKVAVKTENISPSEQSGTPARRVTRRTSQLDDNNDDEVVASPAIGTRRSTRTRKNTTDEAVDTPGRRNTRRTSVEPAAPAQVGTPQRRTTRASSIQSEDGNSSAVPGQKQPTQATIQEEDLPVGRRTRASSVTSDDGSVANAATPKKRGRKSLAANVKIIEPVIEEIEENHSPSRPTTRSMSNSPANVSEKTSSPLKPKSPLVTKTPEVIKEEDNADETIKTIAKDISQKLSNDMLESPDMFSSPAASKTKNDNSLLLSSGKKNANTPDRSVVEPMTPNGKTPKSSKNTPTSAAKQQTPKTQTPASAVKQQTPASSIKQQTPKVQTPASAVKQQTPTSAAKQQTPKVQTPASSGKQQTPTSNKKSPSTPASSKNASVAFIPTPFPTKEQVESKEAFSKSWSQPVFGSSASKIDNSGSKKIQRASMGAIKVQTMQVSSSSDDSDDDDVPKNSVFADEEVIVTKGYESGDSMNDEEKEVADENRMHEELGEELGSEDSESPDEDEDYDKDSFIASEGEQELLSYSDDDEHLDDSKSPRVKKTARKSAPGRLVLDSSDESDDEVNVSKKVQSEKKVQKRASLDKSPKASKNTLFEIKSGGNEEETDDNSVPDTEVDEEPMDVDETLALDVSLKQNRSLKVVQSSGSEIELPKATAEQIAAAKNSLINAARKIRPNIKPAVPTIVEKVESELAETEDCSTDDEKAANQSMNQTMKEYSSDTDSLEDPLDQSLTNETESAKRKRRRTGSLDESVAQPVKRTKLNVSLVSEEKLDTILEKCNEILRSKKEEKKKNKLIHKKEKEEKKKRKELAKQKEEEEGSDEGHDESLKKKKKKQKIGRKYNKDIEESTSTKQEEISQAVKRSQEILEKKRERKRLKKQAKLEKAKEEGIDLTKKPKNDKENLSNNKHEKQDEKPKKPKTLLTAFEVKQQLLQQQESTGVENGVKEKRDKNKSKKDEVVAVKAVPDKENSNIDDAKQKKKKKTKKVLEPVQESNHSDGSPTSPPAKKRMLSILNPKGSLNKQGFVVDPVTPDLERLKRNRGFVEEPVTPKPIGFKVQTMMPSGEEFVKKANKKRKRAERDIPEPSRLPPKPVWTASGAFEEIDVNDSSDFIPLSTKARSATQFGVSVLNKKQTKENTNGASNGLSSFKMKALYNDKARMRESSKDIARKLKKQKLHKKFSA